MQEVKDITIRLGAAAGDGIQSAGEILAKLLSRSGTYISTFNGNQSAIRGGHVWFHVHAGTHPVYSMGYGVDYLLPFTQLAYDEHYSSVNKGGIIIYDPSAVTARDLGADISQIKSPFLATALKYDKYPIMKNTVAVAEVAALIGLGFDVVEETITSQFAKKPEIAKKNVEAAKEGYGFGVQAGVRKALKYSDKRLPFLHANYTFSIGAVAAGCRFYAAYPMSPASPIVHWMTAHAKELGITVFLGEDEISVINATIGAAHAGARAMCATSGGGFALMQEAVGEAAMTETPVVVVNVMRTGPSTGLPTKTSQGDLNMMLGISQDDFPRAIFAPRNAPDAYDIAVRSFDIAERYQMPVMVLLDFQIADGGYMTIDHDFEPVDINRGKLLNSDGTDKELHNGTWFRRYQLTPDNISPRPLPGTPNMMYVAKTDEHDEWGHDLSDVLAGLKESVLMREKMQEKRMKKMEQLKAEMKAPELVGQTRADLTIVSWGSSANPVREAMEVMNSSGLKINALEFSDIYPLNTQAVVPLLKSAERLMIVEANYTSQFGGLLRKETGIDIKDALLKYNGEPIYPVEVERMVRNIMVKEVESHVH